MNKKAVDFRLMVITGSKFTKGDLTAVIKVCAKKGVRAVQLREKDLPASTLLDLAMKIKSTAPKVKLIINDRLDIALLSKADGLHFPQNGIDIKYLKKYNQLIFGKSVHTAAEAVKAEKSGYNYILFGPVFRTPEKIQYGTPQGLDKLKQVCSSVSIPVFAVGGITPGRVKKCLGAGAHGVAVIRAIMNSDNLKKTIKEFKSELGTL